MVTNVTVGTVENTAVIYLQDGSHIVVEPHQTQSLQLVDLGFCTISEASTPEDNGEHMPPGMAFVNAMVEFWSALAAEMQGGVEATPY